MTIFDLIVEDVLNEISPEQAYDNFYNKLPREDFDKIVSANGKFDGLVKFLLGECMENNTTCDECVELINKYKSIENNARIAISNKIKGKEYESIDEFVYDLEHTDEITRFSKSNLNTNGFAQISKIGEFIVTATFTYEANRKHFGYTQWCTASDRDGRYDGYKQFLYYTKESGCFLIQITDSKNKNKTYQIQSTNTGIFHQICDVEDHSLDYEELIEKIGEDTWEVFRNIIDDKASELFNQTSAFFEIEEKYQKSREAYWEAREIRKKEKIKKIKKEAVRLNFEICKETENKFIEFKEKKLYENLDFVNSLSTLDMLYNTNYEENVEEIVQYYETHNDAVIIDIKFLANGLAVVPIIIKTPFFYSCDEENASLMKNIDFNYSSWWDFDEEHGYVTKGVTIIAETGDDTNLFKSIVRVAFDIDCTGGFYFNENITAKLKNRAFCFGANKIEGFLYLPSNGKTYQLIKDPVYYDVIESGDEVILYCNNQYFIFSKFIKELVDYESGIKCAEGCDRICSLTHKGQNYSTIYIDNEILGKKFVIHKKIEYFSTYKHVCCGVFVAITTSEYETIGIIIDKENDSVYTVFDAKNSENKYSSIFCDGNNLVYTTIGKSTIIYYDIKLHKYFRIENNEKYECDVYGNPIENR